MRDDQAVEDPPVTARRRRNLRAALDGGVRAGAATAFDELYRSEWHGIVAFGWTLTGSWAAAEELAQDAFADAYRRWDHVGGLDRPGAWVRRAVCNRAASHHRRRDVERRGLARWTSQEGTRSEGPATDTTGDRAAAEVDDPAFWAAVRSLPDQQRAAIALHYLDDLPVAEMAEVLGCRPATVKVHLHRGRRALAGRLAALTTHDAAGGGRDHDLAGGRAGERPIDRSGDPREEEDR